MIFNAHVIQDVGLVFKRECVIAFIMQKFKEQLDASVGVLHVVIEKQRVLSAESMRFNFETRVPSALNVVKVSWLPVFSVFGVPFWVIGHRLER
jgi:hypothetical protein